MPSPVSLRGTGYQDRRSPDNAERVCTRMWLFVWRWWWRRPTRQLESGTVGETVGPGCCIVLMHGWRLFSGFGYERGRAAAAGGAGEEVTSTFTCPGRGRSAANIRLRTMLQCRFHQIPHPAHPEATSEGAFTAVYCYLFNRLAGNNDYRTEFRPTWRSENSDTLARPSTCRHLPYKNLDISDAI